MAETPLLAPLPEATPLLDKINQPADLRGLSPAELEQLATELRADMIRQVSQTGGHLGAGLGVVELTIALHHVFNTPHDKLIWDVGHQAYPHKILTGRRHLMPSLRQGKGLSGFTSRQESPYDSFGAGHSSTSISAGLGMAVGRDIAQQNNHVICVVGDGAMSAGMAYEAMNNAGSLKSKLIVILNDNDMSIAPPVGAMSAYLTKLLSSRHYLNLREFGKSIAGHLPRSVEMAFTRAEEYARGMVSAGGTLFEELGFYHVGPIDGHRLDHLLPVLRNLRDNDRQGPVLLHIVTRKGHGYPPAEAAQDKYHGVSSFDIATGIQKKSSSNIPSYTQVFGDYLTVAAAKDDKLVGITAAMPSGTGLDIMAKAFPERCFDVGIAEQHAVTFAAGLATTGLRPFCAIYSTFLQRGFDQLVHDVVLQGLPVRFCLDRAGYVGADGATHCGAYDLAYLGSQPGLMVMAPSDEAEMVSMLALMREWDQGPSAIRYPRGLGEGVPLPHDLSQAPPLEAGRGRLIESGDSGIAVLSLGTILREARKAAKLWQAEVGKQVTLADARFAKPLDRELIIELAIRHRFLIVLEEGSVGGFAAQVQDCLASYLISVLKAGQQAGAKPHPIAHLIPLHMPDRMIDHDTPANQLAEAGLDAMALLNLFRTLAPNSEAC